MIVLITQTRRWVHCHYCSQPQGINAMRPVPDYTAWHRVLITCPRCARTVPAENRSYDLSVAIHRCTDSHATTLHCHVNTQPMSDFPSKISELTPRDPQRLSWKVQPRSFLNLSCPNAVSQCHNIIPSLCACVYIVTVLLLILGDLVMDVFTQNRTEHNRLKWCRQIAQFLYGCVLNFSRLKR